MRREDHRRSVKEGFAADLRRLHIEAGSPAYLSLRRVESSLAPASLSDVLNARTTPKLDFVLTFVSACQQLSAVPLHTATKHGGLHDLDAVVREWRGRWTAMRAALDATPGSTAASDPSPAELVPRQLPRAPGRFVGRDDDLAWVDRSMTPAPDASSPLVVLSGPSGTGKTACALAWAARSLARYADGQLFADLAGSSPDGPADPAEVLQHFLRALDRPSDATSLAELSARFRTVTADRSLLVVLDDAGSAAQVRPLLPAGPRCATLLTSPDPLDELAVRDGARQRELRPLTALEAEAVWCDALRAPEPLDDRARAVIARCDGIPLTIRVAARRFDAADSRDPGTPDPAADAGSPGGSAAHLDVAATATLGDLAPVAADLPAVLDWSAQPLDPADRRAYGLLSAYLGTSLDLAAASALLDRPTATTRTLLDQLVGMSMLEADGHRYRMHDGVRAWARASLGPASQPELDAATARLRTFYLLAADRADRVLNPHRDRTALGATAASATALSLPRFDSGTQAYRWFDRELPQLVASVRSAVSAGDVEVAGSLPFVTLSFLNLRKPWSEWRAMVSCGLEAPLGEQARARLLLGLGVVLRETGDRDRAEAAFDEAATLFAALGDDQQRAMSLNNLATIASSQRRYDRSEQLLSEAVLLVRRCGDRWREAIVLHNLAEAYLGAGKYARAGVTAAAARKQSQSLKDAEGAAMALTTLAAAHAGQGDRRRAEREFVRALEENRDAGSRYNLAMAHDYYGRYLAGRGDTEQARHHRQLAAGIVHGLGASAASASEG